MSTGRRSGKRGRTQVKNRISDGNGMEGVAREVGGGKKAVRIEGGGDEGGGG
jgi:hypothetical protein